MTLMTLIVASVVLVASGTGQLEMVSALSCRYSGLYRPFYGRGLYHRPEK